MRSSAKKILYASLGSFALLPVVSLAYNLGFDQKVGSVDTPLKTYTKLGTKDPAYIIFTIVNTSLIFLGMITIILILVAGFMWIFAGGEEDKIKKAKDILKGAVMGLVITLGSYGLAQYIFTAIRYATSGA